MRLGREPRRGKGGSWALQFLVKHLWREPVSREVDWSRRAAADGSRLCRPLWGSGEGWVRGRYGFKGNVS
eukprot:scaffold125939_cov39-Phaeocystis_antarctica.AAC.1